MQPLKRSNTIVTNSVPNFQKRNSITDRIALFNQKPKDKQNERKIKKNMVRIQ